MQRGHGQQSSSDDLGVDVHSISADGDHRLLFEINGAKATVQVHEALSAKGQSQRTLEIECMSPETRWLRERVNEEGPLRLVLSSPVQTTNGIALRTSERHRRVSVSLGKLVTRLGTVAFPRLRHNLTPYVFRHAKGADLKVSDRFDPEVIAKILGHQSTRTQASYGLQSGVRDLCLKRAESIVCVWAMSPVRRSDLPRPHVGDLTE